MKPGDLVTPNMDLFISVLLNEYSAWSPGDLGLVVKVGRSAPDDGFVYVTFDGGSGWVLDDEINLVTH